MYRPLSMTMALLLATLSASAMAAQAPTGGRATFVAGRWTDFRLLGQEAMAVYSSMGVEGQPFDWAVRVQVPTRTPSAWDVQILTPPTTVPLKKGEHILAILNVRCTDATNGVGAFGAHIQAYAPSWTGIGSTDVIVGKEWKRVFIHGQASRDFGAGEYELSLHLGIQAQTLEFGGITMTNLGTHVDTGKLPFATITYPGQEPDAPWRKDAAERIDTYRKSELTVRVVDRDGKPVRGANVHVQMQRHAFGFGTFLEYEVMTSAGPDADKLREWTLKMFNRCTTPIYWADWGWANPDVREGYLQCAKWALENKLATRGHCIIYPGWQFLPAAVRPLENDPAALRRRLLEQVAEVTEATRPLRFTEYDVCNELRDLKEIHSLLGRDAVAEWFRNHRCVHGVGVLGGQDVAAIGRHDTQGLDAQAKRAGVDGSRSRRMVDRCYGRHRRRRILCCAGVSGRLPDCRHRRRHGQVHRRHTGTTSNHDPAGRRLTDYCRRGQSLPRSTAPADPEPLIPVLSR